MCTVSRWPASAAPSDAVGAGSQGGHRGGGARHELHADTTSGEEGITLFHALRKEDPHLPIVLMTAWASLATAVSLVKDGAADYLAKPWDDGQLIATVRELLARRASAQAGTLVPQRIARDTLAASYNLCGVVYASAAMHELVTLALHVASSHAPVLITGPNGSGKEKIAEIYRSTRDDRRSPSSRSMLGLFLTHSWRVSSSAQKRGPSPVRRRCGWGVSRPPTAEPCSRTRSVNCRSRTDEASPGSAVGRVRAARQPHHPARRRASNQRHQRRSLAGDCR